jgi:conjugal transfer pilus assembly protein TraF
MRALLSAVVLLAGTAGSAQTGGPPARTPGEPAPYWSDQWRGWHFYEEPEVDAPEPRPAKPEPQRAAPPAQEQPQPELAAFQRLQKAMEDRRNIAIMRPTEANVRRYMELEAQVVERASYFADVAQRVAWTTPALDPSLRGRPVNAKALEVFEHQQQDARSATVAQLGADHVLLFFYRSDCPYCHAFAPVLRAFEQRHGLQVSAVSLDGGPLPGFPQFRTDNGIAKALQVSQVPAVFLAQPRSGRIVPIGFGVLSESQLLERIAVVSSPETAAMLPGAAHQLTLP